MTMFSKLWISFHHRAKQVDHWALYLESDPDTDCDIWHASGETFEFEASHEHGVHPESLPNFREKWLIQDRLDVKKRNTVRDVAGAHTVDNDGAYWDCRIFCFEILGALETKDVLHRSDPGYRRARKRLNGKWRSDDGVSADSSDLEDVDDAQNEMFNMDGPDSERGSKVDSDLSPDNEAERDGSKPEKRNSSTQTSRLLRKEPNETASMTFKNGPHMREVDFIVVKPERGLTQINAEVDSKDGE